ncbi:MAG: DUF1501 domain-containing protein [Pirellulaceae bacterium]|jgi:hypothetical protein|nr:DUF1501 domain-containing protein [Pirellulaceae bacterium]MDP7020213.1 DUF1501 domain-containing protein [Pirellulaceae bacterium]
MPDSCHEFRRLSRRQAISVGAASALGLSLPSLLRIKDASAASSSRSFGAARSVIFIFLHGGHPQHETWDPKPTSPEDIRGEFKDTATNLPGVRFSELLPRCAQLADRLAIVRSMRHTNANHVQACLPAQTGHKHPPSFQSRGDFPPTPTDFPHFGAVMDHLRETPPGGLPRWVQIGPTMTRNNGTVLHGQSPGFLGAAHQPFVVDQDLTKADTRIDAVTPNLGVARLQGRRKLLDQIQSQRRILDRAASNAKDIHYEKAYQLLTSTATQHAFDLDAEPAAARARYPANQIGRSCLLARRLVEAGAPFVNVHWCKTPRGSWDTHSQNFSKMKESLGPNLDHCFATLIEDLEQRGLLDEVLIVPMAEFGRTPKINGNAGRDHWPFVYTLALCGAGLRRGVVEGASDRLGGEPATRAYSPADMAATLYHLLGVPRDTTIFDLANRPNRLIVGDPIEPILA